jgi:hypothetical protein
LHPSVASYQHRKASPICPATTSARPRQRPLNSKDEHRSHRPSFSLHPAFPINENNPPQSSRRAAARKRREQNHSERQNRRNHRRWLRYRSSQSNLSKNHVITILTSHQAIARVWTRAGAEGVVISGRRKEKLDESVRSLEALNTGSTTFLAVVTDVSKEADTNNLFAQVSKTFGRAADVVFASAGVGPPPVPLAEDNVKTWWSTFVSVSSMDAKPAR